MEFFWAIALLGMLYGIGGMIFSFWLWDKQEKLHNDFRIQFQFFLSGILGSKSPQSKGRWRVGIILSLVFFSAFSIAALLSLMLIDFSHSNEPLPWFVTLLFVMCAILYCMMFANWCSIIASVKNREMKVFMLLGALLGPVGLVIAMSLPALEEDRDPVV